VGPPHPWLAPSHSRCALSARVTGTMFEKTESLVPVVSMRLEELGGRTAWDRDAWQCFIPLLFLVAQTAIIAIRESLDTLERSHAHAGREQRLLRKNPQADLDAAGSSGYTNGHPWTIKDSRLTNAHSPRIRLTRLTRLKKDHQHQVDHHLLRLRQTFGEDGGSKTQSGTAMVSSYHSHVVPWSF
jgi:hypothetical protein